MAKRKKGQYILGQGRDFTVKLPSNGIGFFRELEPNWWYVIHAPTGKIVGQYIDEDLAIKLTIGLDSTDKELLKQEIENILTSNE